MSSLQQQLEQCLQEADRYRLLAEQSTDLISRHSATPDWTFIDVNAAITPLLGYTAEEIIGTSGYALFHPEDADNLKNRSDRVRYRDGLYTNVYRYRHKLGHYVWFETTSRSIRDAAGQPQEVICVSRDVTERELALQSTRRLARVVEAASDLILFCNDQDHLFSYGNEAAQHTLGLSRVALTELHLSELFNRQTYQQEVLEALQQAAVQGVWIGAIPLQLPAHSQRIAELREVIAHRDRSKDRIEYYTLIGRDVTQRRRAEEQAKRQQAEMAHMSRLLSVGEMATELAHEINQPLATILNYSNGTLRQLEENPSANPALVIQSLQRISRQANRAAEIIRRMRRFVQRSEFQRSTFAINECCLDVVGFLDLDARERDIRFSFNFDAGDPLVEADRVQIEQVLLNLIRNALEAYAAQQCRQGEIRIETLAEERHVRVSVHDDAGGICSDMQVRLFEPFATSKPNGLGMGLSISRTLIESHGGQLWADSEDGRSHFHFKLPLRCSE